MSTVAFLGALEVGLIFGLVALAVYLSFRVLNFPDLTVDGSFPLGAAITATLIVGAKWGPYPATAAGALGGAAAGALTGWLNVRLKLIQVLAGILVMTALYSVNLRIMGRPNVALLDEPTVFTLLESRVQMKASVAHIVVLACMVAVVVVAFSAFMASRIGLSMRAAGANARMARANGVNVSTQVIAGLALSNAIAALAGALFAQSQGAADATMGIGTIVIGLASLIVGEGIAHARSVLVAALACLAGSILYRLAITLALNVDLLGLQAQDLSLLTAVLVAVAVVAGNLRRQARGRARARATGPVAHPGRE